VCIPTYNGEAFIAAAIRSVLAQRWQEFELLVVDDQSTDATFDIVRSFADPRIRLYRNDERLGIPRNWNRCLALAQGEYVCLFHQDDVMLPENLQRKVQVLAADPTVSFVHSAVELIVENSAPTLLGDWIEKSAEDFITDGPLYFRKLLFRGDCICAPAVVARRQQLLDLGGFDEELGYACDYEMWMKLCVDSRVAFLSQPLIRYRWHGRNASHGYRFEQGVEEITLASRRALQYYLERTGRQEEGEVLADAIAAFAELRRWVAELEKGKTWLEEQWVNWQKVAQGQERMIQEQKAWIGELEKGKEWLDGQWRYWQAEAERRATVIAALEKDKAWVEEQWRSWRESAWGCMGVRLGMLKLPSPPSSASDQETH
jgi:glycosyltransferase involved in cell wall biosynthesis